MAIAVAGTRTALVNAYIARCVYASLHSAAPGGTGANELNGTGAARGLITWSSVTDNGTTSSATWTATVTMPTAGGTADYVGAWSAVTAGTFGDEMNATNVTYPGPGFAAVSGTYSQT